MILLADRHRQWVNSHHGLEASEALRAVAFLGHTISQHGVMHVADATKDPRFAGNPLVTGEPRIRFHAGMALRSTDGRVVGTVCLMDTKAREFSHADRALLASFTEWVEQALAAREIVFAPSAERRWWLGILITAMTIGLCALLSSKWICIPDPPAIVLVAVVFTAYYGGLGAGLISAAISWIYFAHFFSLPDQLFQYSDDNLGKVLQWAVSTPAIATLTGLLHRRSERRFETEKAREVLMVRMLERASAVTGLREANEQLRLVTENAPCSIAYYDAQLRCRYSNSGYARGFGLTPELAAGKHLREIIGDAQFALHEPERRRVLAGEAVRMDRARKRADGASVVEEVTANPRFDANGKIAGWYVFVSDVTERKRIELKLRRSKERLESALENSDIAVWASNLQTGEIWISDGWAACLDRPRAETHTTAAELLLITHPDDRQAIANIAVQVVKGEIPAYAVEHRVISGSGKWKWILSRGRVTERDASGRALRMSGTNVDITERRHAETAGRVADARYRALFEAAVDGMVIRQPDGEILDVNPAVCRRFGYTRDEIVGRRTLEFVDPKELVGNPMRTDASERWDRRERILRVKDGAAAPTEIIAGPMPDGNVLAILRDITERKRHEIDLAESEARFRAIFERSKAGIATWGLDGRFLTANNAFCDFVGYAAGELIGKMSAGDLRPQGEIEELDVSGRMMRGKMVRGEISHVSSDRRFRRRDASMVWGRTTVAAVTGKDGALQYFIAVVIDITEAREARKRIEKINAELDQRVRERTAELRLAVEKLEEMNRDLDSFNFSIAHDLRQPLNAIGGFADLLHDSPGCAVPGDVLEFAREIETNASRMEQMIEALLRFANVRRGALNKAELDMRGMVEAALRDLGSTKPLRAEVSIGELPAALGDEALLRHVWSNLIGNALKYSGRSPAPKVEISGTRRNGTLEYTVRDNGVGFDMRYAQDLFGVFQRLPNSAGFEGTGVGLAIVQRIVRRHGGQISAESTPGQGATFRFTLPA